MLHSALWLVVPMRFAALGVTLPLVRKAPLFCCPPPRLMNSEQPTYCVSRPQYRGFPPQKSNKCDTLEILTGFFLCLWFAPQSFERDGGEGHVRTWGRGP